MCGRFSQMFESAVLGRRFEVASGGLELSPRYNIAPGQEAGVIRHEGGPSLVMMRWGLVPSWAKGPKKLPVPINARGETLGENPFFRDPLRRSRCLVPADGFYEWAEEGSRKLPWRFTLKEPAPFAFAGLWDAWVDKDSGREVHTFTIVTTRANELVRPVHGRMPVILRPEHEAIWLAPDPLLPKNLGLILTPFASGEMRSFRVSTQVNSPSNEGPHLIRPVGTGGGLFTGGA